MNEPGSPLSEPGVCWTKADLVVDDACPIAEHA